jgi:alpha-tubulin suppressor-like RCC1 family protein
VDRQPTSRSAPRPRPSPPAASHTCALVEGGKVRCWGGGTYGQLGYGNVNNIGDNETPASAGDVPLGGVALQVTAGEYFSCAIVDDGKVRCWGLRGPTVRSATATSANIGDDELPSSVDHVFLGTPAKLIASGRRHTCALATDESVHCWGLNSNGQLGLGTIAALGDNETPSIGGFINFAGGKVISLALGYSSSCALLDSGKVRCWGNNTYGQLGQGNLVQIGDNESPNTIEPIDIGPSITHISANWHHVCTRGQDSGVRCFGRSEYGQLGYANILNVGDDELPSSVGKVAFLP